MFKDIINIERLSIKSIHPVLKNLTIDDIYMLMEDYYSGMKVKDLSEKYNLNLKSTNIIPYFPQYLTDVECPYCEGYMTSSFLPRTNNNILKIKDCSICGHTLNKNCRCGTCKEIENKKTEELKDIQQSMFKKTIIDESTKEMINENELTMRQLLYIATLLHSGLTEDIKTIKPIEEILDIIGPSPNFTNDILKYLYHSNIIAIDEKSHLDTFIYDLNNQVINSYNIRKASYRINIKPIDNDYKQMIKRLMFPDNSLFNYEFCYELWKEINLAESIQYFKYHMNKVKFTTDIGEKTRGTFERMVNYFSLSEIFYIIHRSIANGTKLYQSGEYSKQHAINIVKREISNYSERALANKWNLTGYNRDYNLPESMLSKILFNNIMKIDYLGFRTVPTIEL